MSDYWEKRAAWDMYERMADAEDTADLVARIYIRSDRVFCAGYI